uniref:Uncharacterized protein n=1 Tax=Zea mays TaxID=4577 RepID=C0PJ61_MAIZE|nr:unknown [Zea mays]
MFAPLDVASSARALRFPRGLLRGGAECAETQSFPCSSSPLSPTSGSGFVPPIALAFRLGLHGLVRVGQ